MKIPKNIFVLFSLVLAIFKCSSPLEPIDQDRFYVYFTLPQASYVKITIENNFSKNICTLFDDYCHAGAYGIPWDLKDENGKKLYEGIYHINIYIDNELINTDSVILRNK